MFCRGRATAVGNWRATQDRSYFARRLTDRWWVWGIDTQLSDDIDAPQADYFAKVAQSMRPDDNVILCTGVPCWLHCGKLRSRIEAGKEKFYRSLDYIAEHRSVARARARASARCCRVTFITTAAMPSDDGVQFITAGGGGAFLHPTHNSDGRVHRAPGMGDRHKLSLKTDPADPATAERRPRRAIRSARSAAGWC